MTDETETTEEQTTAEPSGPERETIPPARSAGYEDIVRTTPMGVEPTLPFDPEEVTVDDLPDALADIDDEDTVHELQRADTRKTAAAHYERRIDDIRDAQEG